jgi:hypothetical protein
MILGGLLSRLKTYHNKNELAKSGTLFPQWKPKYRTCMAGDMLKQLLIAKVVTMESIIAQGQVPASCLELLFKHVPDDDFDGERYMTCARGDVEKMAAVLCDPRARPSINQLAELAVHNPDAVRRFLTTTASYSPEEMQVLVRGWLLRYNRDAVLLDILLQGCGPAIPEPLALTKLDLCDATPDVASVLRRHESWTPWRAAWISSVYRAKVNTYHPSHITTPNED